LSALAGIQASSLSAHFCHVFFWQLWLRVRFLGEIGM
jgi:hypothetical protein